MKSRMETTCLAIVLAAALAAAPAGAHGDEQHESPHGAAESAKPAGSESLADLWKEVKARESALSGIIQAKELAKVHEAAFAVRDFVAAMPGKSGQLSEDQQKKLAANVKFVAALAGRLDTSGDAGEQAATEASFKQLQAVLTSIEALYPPEQLQGASSKPTTAVPDAHHHHGHEESAVGSPGIASEVTRTVAIDMIDAMRFEPAQVSVKQGETIRFVVKNSGRVKHEFVIGTEAELKEHYQVMLKYPDMQHADPNQVAVLPGQTGEVVWKFTKAGNVDFACLQPGHYDAGMKGIVAVAAGSTRAGDSPDSHAGHEH